MRAWKPRRGFWTGVTAGLLLAWVISRLRLDLNQVARAGYNLFAPFYDRALAHARFLPEVRQALIDSLNLKPGDQVLEVAVGTGANLPLIAPRIGPNGKIHGLDISEGMLSEARIKLPSIPCPVELQRGNAEDLPFPDDYFDVVLNFGAMNFITDRRRAIAEMVRVAKPGAKIAVGDETLAPDGFLRSLLSRIVLNLIPRLRPPVDLVPDPRAHLEYVADGYIYLIDWRKSI